jgi:ABC-type uncharacterized transport system permease subunit
MSLKAFHVFFISLAVLLCLGFGVWCLGQPGYTAAGIASFAVGAALVAYEVIFLRRFKTR